MNTDKFARIVFLLIFFPITLMAQLQRDIVPLKPWPAPLYWQPTQAENQLSAAAKPDAFDNVPAATTPANSLVFVGMTPCRVVDTRASSGFTGAFGPPSLAGGSSRTFPIQSSATCSIPSIAQAYSFNITIVPPGFLDYITVWPTGQPRPFASTLNGYVNTVIANAAIVPAGTSGSVDVFASQNTELIIDINGYYAPQSGITLAQGTAATPSLSFAGDPGTGIFSSGAGTLNIATGGATRLSVASNGDLNSTGNFGAGGAINTATQYNLGGSRILSAAGTNNLFVGMSAGQANTTGTGNVFVGAGAGQSNTIAAGNSFFGSGAGRNNISGGGNAFFGTGAGQTNSSGGENAFFGSLAGLSNTGSQNSFFGSQAGVNNTANGNSFFGYLAGLNNAAGSQNAFFGQSTGFNNTTGRSNSFFGYEAGLQNTTGEFNAFFGDGAGRANGTSSDNSLFGFEAGWSTTSSGNSFLGSSAGQHTTSGNFNSFFGRFAGYANVTGANNTAIGSSADFGNNNLDHATAIGADAVAPASNQVQIGRNSIDRVSIGQLGSAASTPICMFNSIFSSCSSSRRYKENIEPFSGSLSLLQRLRPVTFDWKNRKEHDLGLIAEEVFEVEPLLVTHNDKGEIEGVKYDKLTVVLINVLKDQQERIHQQQQQIEKLTRQQEEFNAVKRLVCADHPTAALCKEN